MPKVERPSKPRLTSFHLALLGLKILVFFLFPRSNRRTCPDLSALHSSFISRLIQVQVAWTAVASPIALRGPRCTMNDASCEGHCGSAESGSNSEPSALHRARLAYKTGRSSQKCRLLMSSKLLCSGVYLPQSQACAVTMPSGVFAVRHVHLQHQATESAYRREALLAWYTCARSDATAAQCRASTANPGNRSKLSF